MRRTPTQCLVENGDGALAFPPSEITRDSVEAALKVDKGTEAQLLSFKVYEFTKKGDHYMTRVVAADVKYSIWGTKHDVSYVIKYDPRRFKAFESFAYILFQKEEVFYRQVVKEIHSQLEAIGLPPLRVPRCFHSSLEEGHEVIFLEDLRPRGFKMFDRKKGMDTAHTKLALQELARLHAASHLLKKSIPDFSTKYPVINLHSMNYSEEGVDRVRDIFSKQMKSVGDMLKNVDGYETVEKWLARNKERAPDMLQNHVERIPPFDVLCHGDCWNNNLLFRYNEDGEPVEVMLLDLQLCRQASLATDLNYLFHSSLEGSVRKANLDSFLDVYYSTFLEVTEARDTKMPFSRHDLLQEYRKLLEYGLLKSLFVASAIIRDVKNDEEENFNGATQIRFDNVYTSPMFRSRFLCILDEMMENNVIS